MKYIEALLIKFAMIFSALFIILGLAFGVELYEIFIISLIITAVGFVGDLIIYPKTSNKIATGGDFVIVFLAVWLLGLWLIANPDFSLIMAALFCFAYCSRRMVLPHLFDETCLGAQGNFPYY